ncbi:MAG: DUF1080 domain-containing protein [Ignavibacteriales bacterium]|nr:DUF1080 domain-containing protein [Ignavibacteriales bacterium]MCB9260651.1 DUF1080 domain-containing protein [Ignavibacteriales bacterium]
MKKTILIILLLLLVNACNSEVKQNVEEKTSTNNFLTEEEKENGWQLLFDGKSFEGWRGIGIDSIPVGHWTIEDDCIKKIASGDVPLRADGQPLKGGDLLTEKTYNNFEFSFEWKISSGGNSGVKYNVIEQVSIDRGSFNALGYEYQVLDDEKNSDNLNPTHRSASLYDMIEAKTKNLKPVGEFNSAKIVFNNNHGEHWLNGEKVVEYDIDTPEFEELFKKSKYSNNPDFTKHKIAHIVLQDHGSNCWYRNIKIRELK